MDPGIVTEKKCFAIKLTFQIMSNKKSVVKKLVLLAQKFDRQKKLRFKIPPVIIFPDLWQRDQEPNTTRRVLYQLYTWKWSGSWREEDMILALWRWKELALTFCIRLGSTFNRDSFWNSKAHLYRKKRSGGKIFLTGKSWVYLFHLFNIQLEVGNNGYSKLSV